MVDHRIRQLSRPCVRRSAQNCCFVLTDERPVVVDRGSPIAEVSVEDIKALADHVDAALLPSTASRKLPEWAAKLQDAVALNCCKGDASGERGAAQ